MCLHEPEPLRRQRSALGDKVRPDLLKVGKDLIQALVRQDWLPIVKDEINDMLRVGRPTLGISCDEKILVLSLILQATDEPINRKALWH